MNQETKVTRLPMDRVSVSDYTQEELAHKIMENKKEGQDYNIVYNGFDFSSVGLNSEEEFLAKYQDYFYKLRVKDAKGNLPPKPEVRTEEYEAPVQTESPLTDKEQERINSYATGMHGAKYFRENIIDGAIENMSKGVEPTAYDEKAYDEKMASIMPESVVAEKKEEVPKQEAATQTESPLTDKEQERINSYATGMHGAKYFRENIIDGAIENMSKGVEPSARDEKAYDEMMASIMPESVVVEKKEEQQLASNNEEQQIANAEINNNIEQFTKAAEQVLNYYNANGPVVEGIPAELQTLYEILGKDTFETCRNTGIARYNAEHMQQFDSGIISNISVDKEEKKDNSVLDKLNADLQDLTASYYANEISSEEFTARKNEIETKIGEEQLKLNAEQAVVNEPVVETQEAAVPVTNKAIEKLNNDLQDLTASYYANEISSEEFTERKNEIETKIGEEQLKLNAEQAKVEEPVVEKAEEVVQEPVTESEEMLYQKQLIELAEKQTELNAKLDREVSLRDRLLTALVNNELAKKEKVNEEISKYASIDGKIRFLLNPYDDSKLSSMEGLSDKEKETIDLYRDLKIQLSQGDEQTRNEFLKTNKDNLKEFLKDIITLPSGSISKTTLLKGTLDIIKENVKDETVIAELKQTLTENKVSPKSADMMFMSKEELEALQRENDAKVHELYELSNKSEEDIRKECEQNKNVVAMDKRIAAIKEELEKCKQSEQEITEKLNAVRAKQEETKVEKAAVEEKAEEVKQEENKQVRSAAPVNKEERIFTDESRVDDKHQFLNVETAEKLGLTANKEAEENYDLADPEKDSLFNFAPIKKIKEVTKKIYDKITSIDFKNILKEHGETIKRAGIAIAGTAAIFLVAKGFSNGNDVVMPQTGGESLHAEAISEEEDKDKDDNKGTEVDKDDEKTDENEFKDVKQDEETQRKSLDEAAESIFKEIANGNGTLFTNVNDAVKGTNGIDAGRAISSSWNAATPGVYYGEVDGSYQKLSTDQAESYYAEGKDLVALAENQGIGIGWTVVSPEESQGMSR